MNCMPNGPIRTPMKKRPNKKSESDETGRLYRETYSESIEEFLSATGLLQDTDCNPIGQRPSVYIKADNAKSVNIIDSMLYMNIDLGTITLVNVKHEKSQWAWESLDGGHRKRAIRDFKNNKFKVRGKYYSDLTEDERETFLQFMLNFTLYGPMTNEMKGKVWRTLNKTTPPNQMETLNSYGNIPIANSVREKVRLPFDTYGGKMSNPHDLFELKRCDEKYKWLKKTNKRLELEEYVAQAYWVFYKGIKLCNRKTSCLEEMYNDKGLNEHKVKSLTEKVDKYFDFLYEMARANKGVSRGEMPEYKMQLLLTLYVAHYQDYGSLLEPINSAEFYQVLNTVNNDYYNDANKKYKEVVTLSFEAAELTKSQIYRDYSRCLDNEKKQRYLVEMIRGHEFWKNNIDKLIVWKDPTRCFSHSEQDSKLSDQNYKCYIDGEALLMPDAEAAHKIAHSKGGLTEYGNFAMVRKKYNSDMGTMDCDQYKSIFWNNRASETGMTANQSIDLVNEGLLGNIH